jgi:hypothetical protein
MWMRVCITKATSGEYFAGTITVYNGASNQGQYNGHYGSRYVQFGTSGGKAMLGRFMGDKSTTKTLKGLFRQPDERLLFRRTETGAAGHMLISLGVRQFTELSQLDRRLCLHRRVVLAGRNESMAVGHRVRGA